MSAGPAAPRRLWAAVLAVVASADGNAAGYGALNPVLYQLAQQSPGTYLNDVTSGNNDYNATNGGQYAGDERVRHGDRARHARGIGAGDRAHGIPLDVVVSGSQTYGGSPRPSRIGRLRGLGTSRPSASRLNTSGVKLHRGRDIDAHRPDARRRERHAAHLLLQRRDPQRCQRRPTTRSSTRAPTGDFTVSPAPVDVAVSGSQTYGGSPTFSGTASPPAGLTRQHGGSDVLRGVRLLDHFPDPGGRQPPTARGVVLGRVAERHQRRRLQGRLHQRGRRLHGRTGAADHHRLERVHDLRRHAADHQPRLRRLRQRPTARRRSRRSRRARPRPPAPARSPARRTPRRARGGRSQLRLHLCRRGRSPSAPRRSRSLLRTDP